MRKTILEEFKQRGTLTREYIAKKMGTPEFYVTTILSNLRSAGHVFEPVRDKKNTRWVCAYTYLHTKAKPKKPVRRPVQEETVSVACMLCGSPVSFTVLIGAKDYDMRRICQGCKSLSDGRQAMVRNCPELTRKTDEALRKTRAKERDKMKVYKPGDADFDRVAAQCTPVKEIKSSAEKNFEGFNF